MNTKMECAAPTPIDAHCAKCDDEMPTDPYLKVVVPMTDESHVRTRPRVTSSALVEANPRAHDNVNWDHSQGARPRPAVRTKGRPGSPTSPQAATGRSR
jgi:hypothetical protein